MTQSPRLSQTSIHRFFESLPEPRRRRKRIKHPLLTLAVIALCGTIAGADDWEEIVQFARDRRQWLNETTEAMQRNPQAAPLAAVVAMVTSSFGGGGASVQYFYTDKPGGFPEGPVDVPSLRAMVEAGQLNDASRVAPAGTSVWTDLGSVLNRRSPQPLGSAAAENSTALIDCPACGRQISVQAAACPQCGHPNRQADPVQAESKCYACSSAATTRLRVRAVCISAERSTLTRYTDAFASAWRPLPQSRESVEANRFSPIVSRARPFTFMNTRIRVLVTVMCYSCYRSLGKRIRGTHPCSRNADRK